MRGSRAPKPLPPLERVQELLTYEPDTGLLRWRQSLKYARWSHESGDVAGKPGPDGCLVVWLEKWSWRAHRLIWLLVTGNDPGINEIDHRDGNASHNWWSNLRLATRSEQLANRRRPRNNKSGVKGVMQRPSGRWSAYITFDGKGRCLGTYDTFDEAVAVRRAAEIDIHRDYSAGGRGDII